MESICDVLGCGRSKAGAGYRLFVRFRDGLSGHLLLQKEELTGVLAPLRDPGFFEQVFIEANWAFAISADFRA